MVVRAAGSAWLCCSARRIASSSESFVGAFAAGVGATAGGVAGGNGGIFCPWPTAREGSASSTVAHANPFLMEQTSCLAKRQTKRPKGTVTNEREERTTRGQGARAAKSGAEHRQKFQTLRRRFPVWSKLESSPCSAAA